MPRLIAGLDRAGDLEPRERPDRAVEAGDHADRQGLALAERASHRDHRLAHPQPGAGAERQRAQRDASTVDPEQGGVGIGVGPDDAGPELVAVGELNVDLARPGARATLVLEHDVRVGGDLSLAVDHKSRAERPGRAGAPEVADDGHHAGRLAPVDRLRVEAVAGHSLQHLDAGWRNGGGAGRTRPGVLRRLRVASTAAGEHGHGHQAAGERAGPHDGSSRVNSVRPGTDSTRRCPLMRSASSRAIASPSPEPWASSEVKNGSKMRGSTVRWIPRP